MELENNKIKIYYLKELKLYVKKLIEDTLYAKVNGNTITLTSENVKIKLTYDGLKCKRKNNKTIAK